MLEFNAKRTDLSAFSSRKSKVRGIDRDLGPTRAEPPLAPQDEVDCTASMEGRAAVPLHAGASTLPTQVTLPTTRAPCIVLRPGGSATSKPSSPPVVGALFSSSERDDCCP